MSEITELTWDQLEARGQLRTHITPGNIIEPCYCGKCETHFSCSYDYSIHKCTPKNTSKGKLSPTDLDRLPWKAFNKRDGWWIFSNQATYLQTAINNGHTTFGNYRYWISEDGKFIGRSVVWSTR